MAPTLLTVVAGLYWPRASATGAYLAFVLGAGASLTYLLPGAHLSVAAAGNLSWGLALAGLLLGLVAALAPAYLFPQFLGMAPLAARDLILLALALLVSYGAVRYLRRHPEHNVLVPTRPKQ